MNKTVTIYNLGSANKELLSKKINYWQAKGVKARLVCPKKEKRFFKKVVNDVELLPIPNAGSATNKLSFIFVRFKRTILTAFLSRKISNTDVLYSISSVLDLVLLPFFIKLFKPKIMWTTLYENHVELSGQGNFIIRLLAYIFHLIARQLIRRVDTIFVISPKLKRDLVNLGYNPEKLVITGNAINTKAIELALKHKKYEYDGLFMGRLDPQKGVFDLLKITQKIKNEFPKFKLIIAGRGLANVEDKLKLKIKNMNLTNNVKLVGYISGNAKYKLLVNSKVFIFPSYKESFGVSLLEAVTSGTTAIAYDLPVYSDIYQNNEIKTVPKGKAIQLAQKVIETLKEKDYENKRGLQLLKSKKYSYERISNIELESFFTS